MRYKKIEGAKKLVKFIQPMLAQSTDRTAFNDPEWIFEIKWDGYRAIAEIHGSDRKLYSRNGLSFAVAYKKIFDSLSVIRHQAVLDGEIVVLDEDGRPSFQRLQNYTSHSRSAILYYVFDCLSLDGRDLTSLPLLERKNLLRAILPEHDHIRYCDHVTGDGIPFFNAILEQNLEGMIAKKADSLYAKGKRTPYWLKIRNIKQDEALIVGFTAPKGSREGFGSLLLAQYHKKKLTYIGNVGTGFNAASLQDLMRKLKPLARPTSPLDVPVKVPGDTTWVDPAFVCQIKFTEKTTDGILRHPVFLGLRIDKEPEQVITGPLKKRSPHRKVRSK
jgi:bifunctional non-homologous end joining protein LigD